MASAPFEIIVSPFEVYLAPTGESFPDVDETPAGNWELFGTNGNQDYNESGITVTHEQTIVQHRFLGSTGPRKATRTSEGLMLAFTLHDMSPEFYAKVMNDNTVSTTAAGSGTPGYKEFDIYMDRDVTLHALLARGDSPEGAGWNMQYEVPVVFRDGSPSPVFNKSEPAGLAFEFTALEDPNAATTADRFGRLIVQHATAL